MASIRSRRTAARRLRLDDLEGRITPALFTADSTFLSTLNNNGCVAVADFDNDGLDDFVMSNYGPSESSSAGNFITIFRNVGDGTYQTLNRTTGGTNVSFVDVGDIDGDGWVDIVASNGNNQNTGSISVFENNNGSFGNVATGATIPAAGNNTACVRLFDMTGDGELDLVTASFGRSSGENIVGANVAIFAGNGDFTFNPTPLDTLSPDQAFIPTAVAVGDFNADGNGDIAASVPGIPPDFGEPYPNGLVYVFTGEGGGSFSAGTVYDSGGSFPININAADLDGDGLDDLIVANAGDVNASITFDNDGVAMLRNTSTAGSADVTFGFTNVETASTYGPFSVAAGDFDSDGDTDVAAINYGSRVGGSPTTFVSVYLGDGSGTNFAPDTSNPYDAGVGASGGQYIAVGQFDDNASPDLVVANETDNYSILLNTTVTAATVTINKATGQADPTNGSTITYTVVFSEAVTGFDATDVNLSGSTGGGAGLSAEVITVSATTYTVNVTGMSGTGNVVATIGAGAAQTVADGSDTAASTSTDNTVAFDLVPPSVTINQAASQADPATSGPVLFTVVFNEPVTGFAAADVDLSLSSFPPGSLTPSITGSGTTYTVSVSGMSGNGTVVARVVAGAANDAAGNASLASTSDDNSVTVGPAPAPTVTINQAIGQPDPTNGSTISFTVAFSQAVTGFDGSDIIFSGTVGGTPVAQVVGSGQNYTVNVTGMAGTGTVIASVAPGAAVNSGGTGNLASTSTDNSVTFDGVGPTVTVNQAIGQPDPTTTPSVAFTVIFSEPVTEFTAADVSTAGSTAGGTLLVDVQGTGTTYTVTITGMVTTGSVRASVIAGAVSDSLGNLSSASTSTDNTVQFLEADPGVLGFSAVTFPATEGDGPGFATITVTRTGGTDGPVSINYATSDGTARISQGDYTSTSGTLTWPTGVGGPQTFMIPILPDSVNEGREGINLTLSGITGGAVAGTSLATALIGRNDGDPAGTYFDQDNDKYTIKLAGGFGSLLFYRHDPDGDGKGPIDAIELSDTLPDPTLPKSVLSVKTKKSPGTIDGGTVSIGAIFGSGLKKLVAPKANLTIEGVNLAGHVSVVKVGNVLNGADIITGGAPDSGLTTKISALTILDGTDVTTGSRLAAFKATAYGAGTLTAPTVGKLTIKGAMNADLDVSGVGPYARAVDSIKIKGAVTGSDMFINGDVGSVSVGAFRDSRLFAGYTGEDDGSGMFEKASTVGSFKTTGTFEAFKDSRLIATVFQKVSISNLVADNGGEEFGFYAELGFGSLKVLGPTPAVYNPALPFPGIVDFDVKIVG